MSQLADEIAGCANDGFDAPLFLEAFIDRNGSRRPAQLPLPLRGAA
jgi:hypothetical protein